MAVAVDVINRHGPSNEMCLHVKPKKTKVSIHIIAKDVLPALPY